MAAKSLSEMTTGELIQEDIRIGSEMGTLQPVLPFGGWDKAMGEPRLLFRERREIRAELERRKAEEAKVGRQAAWMTEAMRRGRR